MHTFLDGYCSTVQGLLDWFEVDLGFTELLFIQIHLCVMCVFVLAAHCNTLQHTATHCNTLQHTDLCVMGVFVLYSPVTLSSCPFFGHPALTPPRGGSASRVSPQSCQSHESLRGL